LVVDKRLILFIFFFILVVFWQFVSHFENSFIVILAGSLKMKNSPTVIQSMEIEGLRRLAQKWMSHCVDDHDNHAHYVLTELHWNLSELVNPNQPQQNIVWSESICLSLTR
jgi:hypothetical protein